MSAAVLVILGWMLALALFVALRLLATREQRRARLRKPRNGHATLTPPRARLGVLEPEHVCAHAPIYSAWCPIHGEWCPR